MEDVPCTGIVGVEVIRFKLTYYSRLGLKQVITVVERKLKYWIP
jgi:hypothetical protein